MRGIYFWIKMYAHTRLFMMLWWLWVVVGWSKRKMVSRWQGSKSWAWTVSGTAPLHTWVLTSAHVPFLVHLCTCTYLHTCVVFTCILFNTCILEEHNITSESSASASTQVQTHSTTIHSQREFLQKRAAGSKLARVRWHWKGGGCMNYRTIKLSNWKILSSSVSL